MYLQLLNEKRPSPGHWLPCSSTGAEMDQAFDIADAVLNSSRRAHDDFNYYQRAGEADKTPSSRLFYVSKKHVEIALAESDLSLPLLPLEQVTWAILALWIAHYARELDTQSQRG